MTVKTVAIIINCFLDCLIQFAELNQIQTRVFAARGLLTRLVILNMVTDTAIQIAMLNSLGTCFSVAELKTGRRVYP